MQGGARVNSCMAHVIARHRVEKNHRLTHFCLFVCGVWSLRVNISGTSRVTTPVCRVLVQYQELPTETDDCSRGCPRLIRASPTSAFHSLVGGKRPMMLPLVGRV